MPRATRPPDRATQAEPESKAPASATILRAGPEPPTESRGVIGGPGLRSAQSMTPEDRERATRLLQKGEDHLAEGNVSAARLMFERAADVGLAQAAMALAATFDADELARLSVRGIQADAKEARRWYERALQLGVARRRAATASARRQLNAGTRLMSRFEQTLPRRRQISDRHTRARLKNSSIWP